MKIALLCSEDFSLGAAHLSAYLKNKGHGVKVIFDPRQFNKSYLENNFLSAAFDRTDFILRDIAAFKPDLIGFSVFTSSYQWALALAGKIKQETCVPIIFGGIHPTLVPEVVISEDSVDMVCVGEGEEPLAELLGSIKNVNYSIKNIWFKRNGEIIRNDVRPLRQDLDSLPFADRKDLYRQLPRSYSKYPIILTSLGCPYRCTYCANNGLAQVYKDKGKYLRRRSPRNVLNEIKQLKEGYRPRYIIFMDDLFTFDLEWLRIFAPLYREEVGLPYSCLTHAKFLNSEACGLLKDSLCNIVLLGLQSGCQRIRKEVLERPEENEDYYEAVNLLKKFKIRFSLDNILNLPFDTDETIEESLRFYNELRPSMVHSFSLAYFPKAEIIDKGIKAGLLKEEDRITIDRGLFKNYISAQLNPYGDYRKYSFLFTLIPLLPGAFVNWVIQSKKRIAFFSGFPPIFLLLAKFILNARAGTGFVFFTVFFNEWHYFKQTAFGRLSLRFSRK